MQPYLNAIGFTLENNEFKLDYSGVSALFEQVHAQNAHKAFVDLGEFLAYGRVQDYAEGGLLMSRFIEDARAAGALADWAQELGASVTEKLEHFPFNSVQYRHSFVAADC